MRRSVSIVASAEIRIDDVCQADNKSQIFNWDIHELGHRKMCAGVGPIETISIGNNVIVTKSILPNSLAGGAPANVVFKP